MAGEPKRKKEKPAWSKITCHIREEALGPLREGQVSSIAYLACLNKERKGKVQVVLGGAGTKGTRVVEA